MGKILFKPGYSKIIKKVIKGRINIHEIYNFLNHVYDKYINENPEFLYNLELEVEQQVDLLDFHEFQYGQRIASFIEKWIAIKTFEGTHNRHLNLQSKLIEAIKANDLPFLKAQLNYVNNRIAEALDVYEYMDTHNEEEYLSVAYPNTIILEWLEVQLSNFLNATPTQPQPNASNSINFRVPTAKEIEEEKPEENKFRVEIENFKSQHPKVTKTVTGWTEWFVLFKDKEESPIKILNILREEGFISQEDEWIKGNGVTMVALYLVLKEKGYLVNSFSNPQIAQAFNTQFKTKFGQKAYQPEEQNKADKHKDKFNLIPRYIPKER